MRDIKAERRAHKQKDEKQWLEMQAEKEPSLLFVIELSERSLTVPVKGKESPHGVTETAALVNSTSSSALLPFYSAAQMVT